MAEEHMALFEELGFKKAHTNDEITDKNIVNVTMKHPDGFMVDVSSHPQIPQDMTLIRMNVDDFDEAVKFLESKGFVVRSDKIVEKKSSKSACVISPSGFAFDLCQHIK
jgi:predicted RNA binding protein YcfA (HicA-like mRNA interferase family)